MKWLTLLIFFISTGAQAKLAKRPPPRDCKICQGVAIPSKTDEIEIPDDSGCFDQVNDSPLEAVVAAEAAHGDEPKAPSGAHE